MASPDWAFKAIGLLPKETDPKKRYDAVVYAMDKAIGRVLAALDKAGTANNTFVFFMSDNGAEGHDLDETWPMVKNQSWIYS